MVQLFEGTLCVRKNPTACNTKMLQPHKVKLATYYNRPFTIVLLN